MAPEPHYIDVDLKRDTNYKLFSVTQNDTDVTLIIRVSDDGLITDTLLDHFTTVTLTSERPIDRKSFYTSGERIVGTNEIRFKLGTSEIAHVGVVNASVQLYSIDGRVSTAHFSYKVRKDHSEQVVPTVNEASLIERVLVDGPRIMTEAEAAILTNTQATAKLETDKAAALQEMTIATAGANQAAATADQERARMVNEVTQTMVDVDGVMTYISSDFLPSTAQAIADMDLIVQDGNTKATDALDKATTAKTIAETVRTEFDQVVAEAGSNNPEVVNARGTYATLKQRLDTTDGKLADSDRQTQLLQQGANILNADVATPVDFEVQGRTLTSLANSNLESLKYYALADKKSKVIVDGVTVAGIGKFQKKSTTLTTADFVGKAPGSTTANPHKAFRNGVATSLIPPSTHTVELGDGATTTGYGATSSIGSSTLVQNATASGAIPMHLFSFNVIEQVERQLGLIPKTTVAEKVQWIKDNVNVLRANWHGFGSGPSGNKAVFTAWLTGGTWWTDGPVTTNPTITKTTILLAASHITSDGFLHYLAYAEASDGVTASTINTDFINLEIELKATAQLNTRGKIIRVENFEGKVSGSTVENPHDAKHTYNAALQAPYGSWSVNATQTHYGEISTLNGAVYRPSIVGSGLIAQQLFSFNLIEAVERNVGKIPAADVAGKVAWIKENVYGLLAYWNGFGTSAGGNKSSFGFYYLPTNIWYYGSYTHGTVTRASNWQVSNVKNMVDANGFVHYLAFAEPSDGTTASVINTDYIELEIELKPTANFSNPKVPLYEVTKEDFDKIGVSWTDQDTLNRFTIVEGTQHLLNPYVMAEGENLIPPFTEWTLHANSRIISPYEMEVLQKTQYEVNSVRFPVYESTSYFFSRGTLDGRYWGYWLNKDGTYQGASFPIVSSTNSITLKTPVGAAGIELRFDNLTNVVDTAKTIQPMLNIGTQPKPFTPRNPSYLYVETKLGAIGIAKDVLFRQDGAWKRRKAVEKDVLLDGGHAWLLTSNHTGYKRFNIKVGGPTINNAIGNATKYNGKTLTRDYSVSDGYRVGDGVADNPTYVTVDNSDSGFTDAFTPTANDIKRYFHGWKYTNGTTWTSVTGNGQTATAQQALDTKPTDYTPYKLSYVLATPVIENVNVEGDIVAEGLTQVEIGSGFTYSEVDGKRSYTRTPANQRYKLTVNPVNLKAIYAKTIRSAHDDMAVKVGDLVTITSVNVRAIAELYKRMNALGG